MNLTNSTIKTMAYRKSDNKADLRFDDELRGFGVRVYPKGQKSFFVSYRNASGTKKRHTLGKFGELTATQARQEAQLVLADVRRGKDPQSDRQEKRNEMTFSELAELYLDHYKDRKRSHKDDVQRLRDHILPTLGHLKLSEIKLRHLQRIHDAVGEKRTSATANRVAALIKHVFTIAGRWGHVSDNPSQHLTMFREPPPRDIVLSPEECTRLIDASDKDENIYAAALFKLAMFTGRRVGELLNATWEHVDIDKGILTLPLTKADERQFVYLNELSTAILRTLPRVEGTPFIIAGKKVGRPLIFYRRAWLRILDRAGLDYFPPHGLRHNYASTLVAAGIPIEQVGHLLGHKNTETTRKYAHHRPDHLRKAAETFSEVIDFKTEKEKRGW